MDMKDFREQIDAADDRLIRAFIDRMNTSADIARYKHENKIPIFDSQRERQKIASVLDQTPQELKSYASALYHQLFDLSRNFQEQTLRPVSPILETIREAIDQTDKNFPKNPFVACQGVEGAYSQLACEKLFSMPNIMYCASWESVFAAVDSGLCRYGVLPIENSTAGSINMIYDLMMHYHFYIVRSTRLKVNHNLLAKPGTKLGDIKEIFSHEQAITQCAGLLKELKNVKVTAVANTAMAAQKVAESDRTDIAALSSRPCAALYGLDCLRESVQDTGSNFTRFITISKKLEIYPGSDKTSVKLVVSHKPGSLYRILSLFNALGININKLESRPIPDRDFEFMLYFDLDTPIYSEEFLAMINSLDLTCEQFEYLGSYLEVV
ncbi:MAG TPA: prephenate dehydratase domain-containing protein [Candidatus Limiplasma sp.]|nr:prephenate dehydratase domain-containing protein [Candidatus Limiplasma sp.]HRX08255.1 prephenate dehydratase domain-containing protein [Candidatus Limiplasma sp.]